MLVNASAHPYICMSAYIYLCALRLPQLYLGRVFTQLHYPWQMEYICVRLLCGERGADKCV